MRNYLWTIIGLIILFSASLDAQCKRGEKLRITNDIEIKVVDCREATRLIYNDGWYPYSIEDEREDRCPQLASSSAEYYRSSNWELSANAYSEMMSLRCDQWDSDWVNPNEVYKYWAVALEYLGKFDESEKVLIQGLEELPDDTDLMIRLAFSFKKQGKMDEMIIEYERILDAGLEDTDTLRDLASAYGEQGRIDDQVSILKKILSFDPNNSSIQSELARVYEDSGEDPLEIFKARFEDNPENAAYAIEYAEKLMSNGDTDDAIEALENTLSYNESNNMVYLILGNAYNENSDFDEAIEVLEDLFDLDRNNYRVAMSISDNNIELDNFDAAYEWASKALKVSKNNAESLAHMGNLYYKAMNACRGDTFSRSDKAVALLAYNYFEQAQKKGNSKYFKQKEWLEENDVLFGRADWFMLDKDIQATGEVSPAGRCYDWVSESLTKKSDW
jgi:tetratricopeptide (TPR) repeat protein|tara:strand:+ start:445 stop:1782 length:1338 start_codon:yes stop_codon:yes gene_type:complete